MTKFLSKFILKLIGWKYDDTQYPYHLDQFIVAVVPHTSNWDFPLGLLVRAGLQEKIRFAAKDSLFKPAFLGKIFEALGGYPIDRSGSLNTVDAIIKIFEKEEKFKLCIAPEGTRKKVDRLKTGFYYIAKGANIPLVLCKFDYGKKVVTFDAPFYTTDDKEQDFQYISSYFNGIKGKIPANSFGIPPFEESDLVNKR